MIEVNETIDVEKAEASEADCPLTAVQQVFEPLINNRHVMNTSFRAVTRMSWSKWRKNGGKYLLQEYWLMKATLGHRPLPPGSNEEFKWDKIYIPWFAAAHFILKTGDVMFKVYVHYPPSSSTLCAYSIRKDYIPKDGRGVHIDILINSPIYCRDLLRLAALVGTFTIQVITPTIKCAIEVQHRAHGFVPSAEVPLSGALPPNFTAALTTFALSSRLDFTDFLI
jgi:hypothetical protein